jgi:HAD superfamily hydrolase (TIGR01458 family)
VTIADIGSLRGILADMDGVWFVEDRPLPGAADALSRIRARGLPLRLVTNTTTRTCAQLAAKMRAMGLEVDEREIVSPPDTALGYLESRGVRRVRLVLSETLRPAFARFEEGDRPEALVIGDIGNRWNYELMSDLFRDVLGGAEIVALHKGRYWQVEGGLALDIGAFVAGLEYATGKTATVIGKPSPEMYRAALASLGLSPGDVCMIGDDVHHDIAGAQAAGIRGVLVKTGKYRGDLIARSGITPDLVVDSIAAVAAAL